MFLILNLFKKKKPAKSKTREIVQPKNTSQASVRKGEIGEYKIDIQLSQLPDNYKVLNDIMIENSKSTSGYSQVDHIIMTPYGIFVIETKNYQGTIYGNKGRKTWLVNGKFKMMNPLFQNYGHIQAIKKLINMEDTDRFISLVTFTKRCTLKIGEDIRHISSNEMVIYDIYLSEIIKRKTSIAKLQNDTPFYSDADIEKIHHTISAANITDLIKREEHNRSIQNAVKNKSEKTDNVRDLATCVVCDKSVSIKVQNYCLNHEKRFKGKIYCYEHQRSI